MEKNVTWNEINGLEDKEIIEIVGMENLPLITYYLYKKYKGNVQLIDIGNDCMLRFGNTNVANISYLATYIHFITIYSDKLMIEGNISWPAVLADCLEFYISVNGEKMACEMFDAGFDLQIENEVYETRTAFRFEYELGKTDKYKITFHTVANGINSTCGKINSMRFAPIADVLENQYAKRDDWYLSIKKNKICIENYLRDENKDFEKKFQISTIKHLTQVGAEYVCGLRNEYFLRKVEKKKEIWLFFDRLDKADDNGEAFFRYVTERKKDAAEYYFIISKHCPDYQRLKNIGNVVEAFSKEHCILFLLADYIFTSQLNGWVENPFEEYEEYFRDLYHQSKIVFLQHGITKDDQTKWLNRYNQNLYALVASAEAEKKSFLEYPYFYQEKQIWMTGMPRYDLLYHNEKKYILFMPTWRKSLMEQKFNPDKNSYQWYLKAGFEKSAYYRWYHSILNNKYLQRVCKKYGYQLVFVPHPIMQPFIDQFKISDDVKKFSYNTSWRQLFAESSIMITDYSSVAFDFSYLKKPVIYIQFDKKAFFREHAYSKGYFDYKKMGFGKVVRNRREFLITLIFHMRSQCNMKRRYQKRVDTFYAYQDTGCCERIYEKVVRERKQE